MNIKFASTLIIAAIILILGSIMAEAANHQQAVEAKVVVPFAVPAEAWRVRK